jgi:ferredoxin
MSIVKLQLEIDREICQGFGACAELFSESFYLTEEGGKSRLKEGREITIHEGNVKDAIDVRDLGCYGHAEATCPFNAIRITRLKGIH